MPIEGIEGYSIGSTDSYGRILQLGRTKLLILHSDIGYSRNMDPPGQLNHCQHFLGWAHIEEHNTRLPVHESIQEQRSVPHQPDWGPFRIPINDMA